jgi:hypothetical protein
MDVIFFIIFISFQMNIKKTLKIALTFLDRKRKKRKKKK